MFLKLKFTLRQVSWPGLLAYEFIEFIGERDAMGSSKNSGTNNALPAAPLFFGQ